MNSVLQFLRRAGVPADGGNATDGQLLESFVIRADDRAFAALVRRHGPMVLGVCRRILGNLHDAEDAFQATFLVLARKASSIQPRHLVGNWLYGVAYRTALEARGASARRRARERAAARPEVVQEDNRPELQPLLDLELSRLSDKYRIPIVLCDLEGRTRREVARQLGWPEGTVSARLARGRGLLAKRLSRHGLTLSGGAVAFTVSREAASACVPTPLLLSTIEAATGVVATRAAASGLVSGQVAALTRGVLKAMLMRQLKVAAAGLLSVGVLAGAVGALGHRVMARAPAAPTPTFAATAVEVETEQKAEAAPEPPAVERTVADRAKQDKLAARKARAASITAVVVGVDVAGNKVTLNVRTNDVQMPFAEVTEEVDKDARIFVVDGGKEKEGKLANLVKGTVVDYLVAHLETPQVILEIRTRPGK
jgi:RNA polymerase sigma factor (sigma-70 family)